MNYKQWLDDAVAFMESLRTLPGEMKVEIEVGPPLAESEIDRLTATCRLPIPQPLRRFWAEASGSCHATFWWDVPAELQNLVRAAFPFWNGTYIWGGLDFATPTEVVELAHTYMDVARDKMVPPKDARYYAYTLPLIVYGNGDYLGLYVKDDANNPPLLYLDHEGCGGSGPVAPTFDDFLADWQRVHYLGLHFLDAFKTWQARGYDFQSNERALEAIRSLFRCERRTDDSLPAAPEMTEQEWLTCYDPWPMLDWLFEHDLLPKREEQRLVCACCRRMWAQFNPESRHAVEVAERRANGVATDEDMQQVDLHRKQGLVSIAATFAFDGSRFAIFFINCELDEPEEAEENKAQAELVRQFFGNPFQVD